MGGGLGARRTRNGGRIGGRKQKAARMGRNKALAARSPEADEVLDWEEDPAAREGMTTTNIPNPECAWEVIEETRFTRLHFELIDSEPTCIDAGMSYENTFDALLFTYAA